MRQIGSRRARSKGPWDSSQAFGTSCHRRLDLEAGPVWGQTAPGWEEEDEVERGGGHV